MQEMPEISELSKHIMIEETDTGLNIEIVDQDGRSMFPDGAKEPYERTRRIIQKLAIPLKALPNRVSVTGHTAASRVPPRPGYGAWELSADRANAVRQILEDEGLPGSHLFMVAGKRRARYSPMGCGLRVCIGHAGWDGDHFKRAVAFAEEDGDSRRAGAQRAHGRVTHQSGHRD